MESIENQLQSYNTVQKIGPFTAHNNIFADILLSNYTVEHLGIQAKPNTEFYLNGIRNKIYKIGETGIYEINRVDAESSNGTPIEGGDYMRITQLAFTTAMPADTIVDFTIIGGSN